MNRRQFLHRAALSGAVGAALASSVVSAHPEDADSPRGRSNTTRAGNSTATATGTPTETPTDAVATPTSGWEPRGRVAVPGATETILTPDGETAFVATGDGFTVLDLSDPGDPSVLARESPVSPPGTDRVIADIFDVKHEDGRLLAAGPANYHPDAFWGVALYDVSEPADPTLLSAHETTFPVHNCYFADGYAYLTGNDEDRNPLVVVEMGAEPREVGRWSVIDHDERWAEVDVGMRVLHDVWVQDDYAYLAYWDAGTWILDVSDPANPSYVADIRDRPVDELADIDGLAAFREASEPPGNDHYVETNPAGTMLGVGKESWNSNVGKEGTTPGPDDPGGPSGIDLYDVSDKADPVHLATIDPPPTADPNYRGVRTTAHNFDLTSEYLYSSWYRGGVKIHDVSDPENPEEVRQFRRSSDTSFWTAQRAVPGETVVATSYRNPENLDDSGVVYTFPDVPRETLTSSPTRTQTPTNAEPATTTPQPTPTADQPASTTGEPTSTSGELDSTTVDLLSTDTPSETPTDGPEGAIAEGPGFGPIAALAGIGLGAWRLLGRTDGDDGED